MFSLVHVSLRFASKKALSTMLKVPIVPKVAAIKAPKVPKVPKTAVVAATEAAEVVKQPKAAKVAKPVITVKTVSVKKTGKKAAAADGATATTTTTPTSYAVYYAKKKEELLAMNPNSSLTDIRKQIQVLWANLPPEQKEEYDLKKMEAATAAAAVKRVSGYNLFVRDEFVKIRDGGDNALNFKENVSRLSAAWKKLSDSEKDVYNKKAADSNLATAKTPAVVLPKTKRLMSSYMLFSQELRPSVVAANPTMKFVDVAREIGKQWKALSKEQQHVYVMKHSELKAAAASVAAVAAVAVAASVV